MAMVPLTLVNGGTVRVAWFDVNTIINDANDATRCFVYTLNQTRNANPWHVDATAAAVLALLHTASGLTATVNSPFAVLARLPAGALYVQSRNTPVVRVDPDDATRSFVYVSGLVNPWHCTSTAAAVATALDAADPGAGAPGDVPDPLVRTLAGLNGATGAVNGQVTYNSQAATVVFGAHVALSGVYTYTYTGAAVPAAFSIFATVTSAGTDLAAPVCVQTGPGAFSITFVDLAGAPADPNAFEIIIVAYAV